MQFTLLLSALCGLFYQAAAQAGPNTIAAYNPNKMTMSFNGTYIIVPVDTATVQAAVSYPLIPIKADTTRFPKGWPAGKHPVLVTGGYGGSIKLNTLYIPEFLLSGRIAVPCVDRLGDGKTCFTEPFGEYIGGDNGQIDSGLIPALVGSLQGTTLYTGTFTPGDRNLQSLGSGEYSFEVDHLILQNPVSGPGVAPLAFQFVINNVGKQPSLVSESGFHYFINQPQIGNNGMCIRTPQYFNESFAQPFFADAKLTSLDDEMLPPPLDGVPNGLQGNYYNGVVYSGNAQQVIYNGQSCADAAAQTDPKSLQ